MNRVAVTIRVDPRGHFPYVMLSVRPLTLGCVFNAPILQLSDWWPSSNLYYAPMTAHVASGTLQAEFSFELNVNEASTGRGSRRSFNVVFVVESGGAASTSPYLNSDRGVSSCVC